MSSKKSNTLNSGFTLLEILLTMAVLVVGLTAVFQTSQMSLQTMAKARELTEVQNACQAVLNELLARSSKIQPEPNRTAEHLPHWRIRVDIYPAPQPGLCVLHLSAQQLSPADGSYIATRYELLRWVPAERVRIPEPPGEFMEDGFGDLFNLPQDTPLFE